MEHLDGSVGSDRVIGAGTGAGVGVVALLEDVQLEQRLVEVRNGGTVVVRGRMAVLGVSDHVDVDVVGVGDGGIAHRRVAVLHADHERRMVRLDQRSVGVLVLGVAVLAVLGLPLHAQRCHVHVNSLSLQQMRNN